MFFIIIQNVGSYQENNLKNVNKFKLNLYKNIDIINGVILYVGGNGPNNYSNISDALYYANNGDIIYVFNGTYYENIIIDKSIKLIGEDKDSTIIDGDWEGDVVNISADHVIINGFNIRYSGKYFAGIKIHSNYNIIENNIFPRNSYGICIKSSQENIITGNELISDDKNIYIINNSNDNIIDRNTIQGGWAGIYVRDSCDRNIYSNNIVKHCYQGIGILDSRYSILVSNAVQKNKYGMGIQNSNNCTIYENIITENEENGIIIYESIENTISNNIFENDGLSIKKSLYNTVSNNTVNNLPLIYLQDEHKINIPSVAGQIILVNCTKITIQNHNISNTSYAIELLNSQECNIIENTLTNNNKDIYLEESKNNKILNNIINAKDYYSISLYNSYCNNISTNKVNGTMGTSAIFLEYSNNNIISRNILSNSSIIFIHRSNDNSVIRNIMSTGSGHILLRIADNNKIIGNTITTRGSSLGLTIDVSDNNIISENTISNRVYGLNVEKSDRNTISGNEIKNNVQGVSLEDSNYNVISKNNFIYNFKDALCTDSITNIWKRNYWGRPYILPKRIPGKITIYREWPMPPILIPIPSFDLNPAKEPFDI